jgi:hypothetical protein
LRWWGRRIFSGVWRVSSWFLSSWLGSDHRSRSLPDEISWVSYFWRAILDKFLEGLLDCVKDSWTGLHAHRLNPRILARNQ